MRLKSIDHSADLLPLSHEAIYVTQSGDAIFFSFILYGVEQTYTCSFFKVITVALETVQDLLIKLGIKPLMHLLETSI